jgi:hypothetical protein
MKLIHQKRIKIKTVDDDCYEHKRLEFMRRRRQHVAESHTPLSLCSMPPHMAEKKILQYLDNA